MALYRVRQFLRAAAALVQGEEVSAPAIGRLLPPKGVALFNGMPRYDRRHALSVIRTLQQQGHDDPDLLAAALLHDVGKTGSAAGRLRLLHRVLMVLAKALAPGSIDRLGRESGRPFRQAFFVQKHHAELGANLALGAGCSQATAELISRHEEAGVPEQDPRGAALRAADSAN